MPYQSAAGLIGDQKTIIHAFKPLSADTAAQRIEDFGEKFFTLSDANSVIIKISVGFALRRILWNLQ